MLPQRLPEIVARRLRQLGVAPKLVDAEIAAMAPVIVAKTSDASVRGILVDFAMNAPHYLRPSNELSLEFAESRLAETPCYTSISIEGALFPDRRTPEVQAVAWDANNLTVFTAGLAMQTASHSAAGLRP